MWNTFSALGNDDTVLADAISLYRIRAVLFGSTAKGPSLGRYELQDTLGQGGMGVVYLAWDPKLERKIALKHLAAAEGQSEKVLREARALARLTHPNVVSLYDAELVDGRPLIAMEYVEGVDLSKLPENTNYETRLRILRDAANGLAAAHKAGMVHRDVKPQNILVGQDGRARVTDFGLAQVLQGPKVEPSGQGNNRAQSPRQQVRNLLADGTRHAGTPKYMSPEQRLGQKVEARSDQYSFCLSAQEALAPLAQELAPWLDALLKKGLSKEPANRHPSMQEICDALEAALSPKPARRSRLLWGVAILPALAILAFYALRSSDEDKRAIAQKACFSSLPSGDSLWPQHASKIARHFNEANSVLSDLTLARVENTYQTFSENFRTSRDDTCKEQSRNGISPEEKQELDGRVACLRGALERMDSFATLLESADSKIIEKAATTAARLGRLKECDDSGAHAVAGPRDFGESDSYLRVESALNQSDVDYASGRYKEGLAVLNEILPEAETLGVDAQLARLQYQLGSLHRLLGSHEIGELHFHKTIALAEKIADDRLAARAWIGLVALQRAKGKFEEAILHGQKAEAKLARIKNPEKVLAWLRSNQASVYFRMGNYSEAQAKTVEAMSIYETTLGRKKPFMISQYMTLAKILDSLGKRDEAEEAAQEAYKLAIEVHGEDSPRTASTLQSIATAQVKRGDNQESLASLEKAMEITLAVYGPDSSQAASIENDRGGTLLALGRVVEANEALLQALAAREKSYGPKHIKLVTTLNNLGTIAISYPALLDVAAAETYFKRAFEINRRVYGEKHPKLAFSIYKLSLIERVKENWSEAAEHTQKAIALLLSAYAPEHPQISMFRTDLGAVYLNMEEFAKARQVLQLATLATKRTPHDRAYIHYLLAKANYRNGDKKKGKATMSKALTILGEPKGLANIAMRDRIVAWQKKPD